MSERVYAHQGDTLDKLCHRFYGTTAGVTEAVLDANPGLCELGPLLPIGTPVDLPERSAAHLQPAATTSIQLWQ